MTETYSETLFDLREKVRKGEKISNEEYQMVIADLRKNRTVKTPPKKQKSEPISVDQLKDLFS